MISEQPAAAADKCPYCKGQKIVWRWFMHMGEPERDFFPCDDCEGTGLRDGGKSKPQARQAETRDVDADHGSRAEGSKAAGGG